MLISLINEKTFTDILPPKLIYETRKCFATKTCFDETI